MGHKNSADEPPRKVVTTTASNITRPARESKLRPLNFAQLRRQVGIAQVLGHWGWQPQSTHGNQQRGACPLHEEADSMSRSFAVHTGKNVYCCHRCGNEGNGVITHNTLDFQRDI